MVWVFNFKVLLIVLAIHLQGLLFLPLDAFGRVKTKSPIYKKRNFKFGLYCFLTRYNLQPTNSDHLKVIISKSHAGDLTNKLSKDIKDKVQIISAAGAGKVRLSQFFLFLNVSFRL